MGYILLVEDNTCDEELTLRSLRKSKLTNPVVVVRDGAEALAFLFGREEPAGGGAAELPQVILLDLLFVRIAAVRADFR